MFGLFNNPIANDELFAMVFGTLVAIRTAYRNDDSKFDSEIASLLRWIELQCKDDKLKMNSAQRDYVKGLQMICEIKHNEIRTIADKTIVTLNSSNPNEPRMALAKELNDIFRSAGADWKMI